MNQAVLNAAVSASPYDEHYEMALVYCVDKQSGHCFSLSRFPGDAEIEIMVVDQLVEKVLDLEVVLEGRTLRAKIPQRLAMRLEGVEQYIVHLDLPEAEMPNLIKSLEAIFSGKEGFELIEA